MQKPHLGEYLKENESQFVSCSLRNRLLDLFQKKHIKKADVVRSGGMSQVYLYQVLEGKRNPSRDRLLCICFGLKTTEEEAQELLRHGGFAPLYPRIRRDAIILHGIVHGSTLDEVNERLFDEHEKTLY